ncbi:MAG: glucosamine-6-phosphate deaminase [Acidobacteriota bacterium]|nr:glucosamine-6-phosphate deaminase [Acidobacteriota bacterium]
MPAVSNAGTLRIHSFATASEMGFAAATHVADRIRSLAQQTEVVPVVFATGASQLETLRALTVLPGIPWNQVIGFHMDEYIGLSAQHPASFRRYLREELVQRVSMREFHEIDGEASDPEDFCKEYTELLNSRQLKLCLAGIGENGHLAFNDPPEADFNDPKDVKIVLLDQACRRQQVNEGWFSSLREVPVNAITMTIPALLRIPELVLSVPGERKRSILQRTLTESITTACPATVLRMHANTHLYVDAESYPSDIPADVYSKPVQ